MTCCHKERQAYPSHIGDIPWQHLISQRTRLQTYRKYPITAPKSAIILAANGFAYIGSGSNGDDLVICAFCAVQHRRWQARDDIKSVHGRSSPNCPMILRSLSCGNVPWPNLQTPENYEGLFLESEEVLPRNNEPQPMAQTTDARAQDDLPGPNAQSHTGTNSLFGEHGLHRPGNDQQEPEICDGARRPPMEQNPEMSACNVGLSAREDGTLGKGKADGTDQGSSGGIACPMSSVEEAQRPPGKGSDVKAHSLTHASGQRITTPQSPPSQRELNIRNTVNGQADVAGPFVCRSIVSRRAANDGYKSCAIRELSFTHFPYSCATSRKDLAKAGFFYQGEGDCVQCFSCGYIRENWRRGDNPWIGHAPSCEHIRVCEMSGRDLIGGLGDALPEEETSIDTDDDALQAVHLADVGEMQDGQPSQERDAEDTHLQSHSSVLAILANAHFRSLFTEREILEAAREACTTEGAHMILSTAIVELLWRRHPGRDPVSQVDAYNRQDQTKIAAMELKMMHMRKQLVCKVCFEREVELVLLPCGHLVVCQLCKDEVENCPECHRKIEGTVISRVESPKVFLA